MKKNYILILIVLFISNSSAYSLDGYWQKVSTPLYSGNNHWLDIFFLESNPSLGWICGMYGRVIKTTDGGDHWSVSNASNSNLTHHLERIMFVDEKVGFCSGPDSGGDSVAIYKSLDGGYSWIDITPAAIYNLRNIGGGVTQSEDAWGCYFTDANNGLFFGGMCSTDSIYIFKTTNGGNSWTTFSEYCPDNRTYDGYIDNPNGYGMAIGSSVLWETFDGGYTWDTLSVTGDTTRHQEEICKNGNTIVVPYSGRSCDGTTEGVGGVLISTDNGNTWDQTELGQNCYGAYLLDENTAWVSGDNGKLVYTTDKGQNWLNMTCGTIYNNLDDVYFFNDEYGWTVGENAVYRLVPAVKGVLEDSLKFTPTCLNYASTDSIYIVNRSFFGASAHLRRISSNEPEIDLMAPPNLDFVIDACDSIPIEFKYSPIQKNIVSELWQVIIDGDTPSIDTFAVVGYPMFPTAEPRFNMKIDTAYCNTAKQILLPWDTETNYESIFAFSREKGSSLIEFVTQIPFELKSDLDNYSIFIASPVDTGWISATYYLFTNPCYSGNEVQIDCFGLSSIINAPTKRNITASCFDVYYDTVDVYNTGNYDLIIETSYIDQPGSEIFPVGFVGSDRLDALIPPGDTLQFVYRYNTGNVGEYLATLSFINNDSTRVRGKKTPYNIDIHAFRNTTQVSVDRDSIYYGTICSGERYYEDISVVNSGVIDARILEPIADEKLYSVEPLTGGFPLLLSPDIGADCRIYLTAVTSGFFIDTVTVVSQPCGEMKEVIITANVVKPEIKHQPDIIFGTVQANFKFYETITLENIGDTDLDLISIALDPPNPDVTFTFTPSLPLNMAQGSGEQVSFDLTLIPNKNMHLKSCIKIEATGACPLDTCIPIDLVVFDRYLTIVTDTVDFGIITCEEDIHTKQAIIDNTTNSRDTIVGISIEPEDTPFSVKQSPIIYIEQKHQLALDIQYDAQVEDRFTANLIIDSKQPNGQTLIIPIIGEFRKVDTYPIDTLFSVGKIDTCIGVVEYKVNYTNTSTLLDSLMMRYNNTRGNIWTEPASALLVPPNASTEFSVFIDFGIYTEFKEYQEVITLESQICPIEHAIQIDFDIHKPKIDITPTELNFDDWVGEIGTQQITLTNNSGVDLRIDKIDITKIANYQLDVSAPFYMKEDSSMQINVSYIADKPIDAQDTLSVQSSLNCTETTEVILNASSPDERYNLDLEIDRQVIKIDSTKYLTLTLKKAEPNLKVDSLFYKFSYDPDVAWPQKVYFNKGKEKEFEGISFSSSGGSITGIVTGDFLNTSFSKSGPLMKILFHGLAAFPDTTTLWIDEFKPIPNKNITYTKKHGFIDIYDYCEMEVIMGRLVYIPNYNIESTIVNTNQIKINMNIKLGDINFDVKLIDILGNTFINEKKLVHKGYDALELDVSTIPTGTYILKLISPYNQNSTIKVVIVK